MMCNRRKVNLMKHKAIKAAWKACDKLFAEGNKLLGEGYKLHNEGRKLRTEAFHVYRAAVTAKHGDKAIINWETGEIKTRC